MNVSVLNKILKIYLDANTFVLILDSRRKADAGGASPVRGQMLGCVTTTFSMIAACV